MSHLVSDEDETGVECPHCGERFEVGLGAAMRDALREASTWTDEPYVQGYREGFAYWMPKVLVLGFGPGGAWPLPPDGRPVG